MKHFIANLRHINIQKASRSMSGIAKVVYTGDSNKIKSFSDVPGPLKLPIIGNLYQYKFGIYKTDDYHKVLEDLYKKYGPVVRQDLGTSTIVHVFEPEDIKTVYMNEGTMPYIAPLQESTMLYREARGLSPGLGNVNGEQWQRLRNSVRQLMLRKQEVSDYLPLVRDVADDFVKRITEKRDENGEIKNLVNEVGKWSQESAGVICFETRLGCFNGGEEEERAQAMIDANSLIFSISAQLKFSLPIYKYVSTPKWKKLMKAEDFFYKTAIDYTKATLNKLEDLIKRNELQEGKYDFLSYLLSRKELTRNDVIVLTFSMFSDGLTTTVPVLLYNLYCLASNPDAQDKAYQELVSTVKEDEPITAAAIKKLSYMRAVIKESFRLYPNGTEVSRILPKDVVLSGYNILQGTNVNLNPIVHFRSEKYFNDPMKFKPERWLRGDDNAQDIHPYVLTPFSHGVRTCAGMRFAEQDLHVVLSTILRNFKLKYPTTEPLEQVYSTLIFPKGPVRVQFVPRN